jgi:hypothetical protein
LLVVLDPTLLVDIGFDPKYDPATPNARPITQLDGNHALVDTGASLSCIDNIVAATLHLPIVDRQTISGSGGAHEVNMYLAQMFVPELRTTYYGSFAGVDLAAGGQPHVVLIGRDMLQHVRLVYDGLTGQVTITSNDPV